MWQVIAITATITTVLLFTLGVAGLFYIGHLVDKSEEVATAPGQARARGVAEGSPWIPPQ